MHVAWQLDHFDKFFIRRDAAEEQAGALEPLAIFRIKFIAMAVPFADLFRAVLPGPGQAGPLPGR